MKSYPSLPLPNYQELDRESHSVVRRIRQITIIGLRMKGRWNEVKVSLSSIFVLDQSVKG